MVSAGVFVVMCAYSGGCVGVRCSFEMLLSVMCGVAVSAWPVVVLV